MATRCKRCCAWRKRSALAIDPNVRYWSSGHSDFTAECLLFGSKVDHEMSNNMDTDTFFTSNLF